MVMFGHGCGQKLMLMLVTCLMTVTSRTDAHSAGVGHFRVTRPTDLSSITASSSDPVCVKPDLCTCRYKTADCSHHYGRLTYVPTLPEGIQHLIFSFNNLTAISSDAFFSNVTRLTSIDLQHNGLRHLSPDAFTSVTKLRALTLDNNPLTYNDLAAALSATKVQRLSLRYMDLGPPDGARFPRSVQTLDLSGNRNQHLNLSVFQPLRSLSTLRLVEAHMSVMTPCLLPQLQKMDITLNGLLDFPDTCSNGSSLFPRLSYLNITRNSLSDISTKICLPKLNNLVLFGNRFLEVKTDTFSGKRFPSLVSLSLQSMQTLQSLQPFAFRNPSLQVLTVMYCSLEFSDTSIHPDCFSGLPKLKRLQVGHNFGYYISDNKFNQLFGSLTSLEELYMGSFSLQSINKYVFSNMTRLTKLYIYRNLLSDLPDGMFDHLTNLTELCIGDNQLRTIRKTLFSPATRNRLRHLDLSGNPFQCDCDLLWFRDWFVSSPALFNRSYEDYTCSGRVGSTPLKQFHLREQACLMSHQTSSLIIVCVVLLVTMLTAMSFFYQYRWHIRLLLYESFRGRGECRRKQRLETGAFDYDVFVCYAQPDQWWVRRHLMPQLEDSLGLKLCVHERDFVPGRNIVDNIDRSVQSSKKIMMIFSKEFATSQWCQFELALCLQHVIETEDALIVACLEDATSFGLTSAMMAVLKTTTYIQWDESPDAMASFWGRLEQAVNEIMPGDV